MSGRFWDKRIPTLLGLIIISVGTILTTFLVRGGSIFQISAGPGQEPKKIEITNITDSSFTVTYLTDDQVIGTLTYGTAQNLQDKIVLDDRDQLSQSVEKYNVHSITANDLSAETTYFFTITSGDEQFLNEGETFQVTTGKEIDQDPSTQLPLTGKVVLPDGSKPAEGLVYMTTSGYQKLSALINSDGNYTVPLNTLRNSSLTDYFEITGPIDIEVYTKDLFSKITVDNKDISPVPLITVSNNYDFSLPQKEDSGEDIENVGFPTFENVKIATGEPKILTPQKEEELDNSQPVFEGTALPNETVVIEIHSDENIKTQVRADSAGNWSYTPPRDLSPGQHTITVTSRNSAGILRTITQSFTVFAQEISPSPTVIPISILTPTIQASASPTVTLIPSPIPTVPPTGNSTVVIAGASILAAAFFAVVLFFFTRSRPL